MSETITREWVARTPAQKRVAKLLQQTGKARIEEVPANYIGKRGLVVSRHLIVTEIEGR